jgi:hypothetical protein
LANWPSDRGAAQKRGGHAEFVFLDHDSAEIQYQLASEELSAERVFEFRWAASLVSTALKRLEAEMV